MFSLSSLYFISFDFMSFRFTSFHFIRLFVRAFIHAFIHSAPSRFIFFTEPSLGGENAYRIHKHCTWSLNNHISHRMTLLIESTSIAIGRLTTTSAIALCANSIHEISLYVHNYVYINTYTHINIYS